ncbi:uncharacterized protein [Choristoneura fumiferana]|uniref:uncharacterized protein n=1 Tax=Choristoneura fumiferana TaxID=7141 RepID=UPI003D154FA9
MEFGYTRTAIFFVLCIYFVHNVVGMPRTVPIVPKPDDVVPAESFGMRELENSTTDVSISRVKIPGRVPCKFEDATEDEVCMKHCIPKGYSYGVCVSKTCTCV